MILVDQMRERKRRRRCDEQRVAVRRRAGDLAGADVHAAAGDVLDHGRLAPFAAEAIGREPGQDVGGRARRRWQHELHGLRGVIVLGPFAPPAATSSAPNARMPARCKLVGASLHPWLVPPCLLSMASYRWTAAAGNSFLGTLRTWRRRWLTRSRNSAPIITRCSPRDSRWRSRCRGSPRGFRSLLRNPDFVAESFSDDTPPGKRTLHHDPDTDVYVLAHVYEGPKKGSPHSHGASWAVYGTARAVTEMTEWRRVNPESEEQAVLEPVANYSLGPGDTPPTGRACCTPRGIPRRPG